MRHFALILIAVSLFTSVGCASFRKTTTTYSGVDQEMKVATTDISDSGAVDTSEDADAIPGTGYSKTTTTTRATEASVMCGDKPCVVEATEYSGFVPVDSVVEMQRIDNEKLAIKERVPYANRTNGNVAQVGTPFGMYNMPTAPGFVGNARLAGAVALAQQYQALRQQANQGTLPQGTGQGQPAPSKQDAVTKAEMDALRADVSKIKEGTKFLGEQVVLLSPASELPTREEFEVLKAKVEELKEKASTPSPSAPAIGPQLPTTTPSVDPDPVADTQF